LGGNVSIRLSELNLKFQNPNIKQISKFNEPNSKHVWIIGISNLDIVCYLVIGAWNFLSLKAQPVFDLTVFNFEKIHIRA
jgi:hypothetical protein